MLYLDEWQTPPKAGFISIVRPTAVFLKAGRPAKSLYCENRQASPAFISPNPSQIPRSNEHPEGQTRSQEASRQRPGNRDLEIFKQEKIAYLRLGTIASPA